MTDSPPLFEEMLAAYPADKREFARRVYDRFANGDATEFFAQLFLLLDVYANYAKRIPQAVSETNQSTLASLKKVREEIGLLAQIVETRSVKLGNLCEKTPARFVWPPRRNAKPPPNVWRSSPGNRPAGGHRSHCRKHSYMSVKPHRTVEPATIPRLWSSQMPELFGGPDMAARLCHQQPNYQRD